MLCDIYNTTVDDVFGFQKDNGISKEEFEHIKISEFANIVCMGKENFMSTLEKTMNLLQTIPENKLDTVYAFLQFIKFQDDLEDDRNQNTSAFGIAHQYANANLIPLEKEAFADAMTEKHAIICKVTTADTPAPTPPPKSTERQI